jgi:hypothetical protein
MLTVSTGLHNHLFIIFDGENSKRHEEVKKEVRAIKRKERN